MTDTPRWKKNAAGAALLLVGIGGGAALAGNGVASAAGTATSAVTSAASSVVDETRSVRADEHLLTGDTATRVRDAALAKYPGATVQRVETDSDGVYEAHLVTTDGSRVVVQVGADFAVTGTQQGGGPGGHGPGGPGTGAPGYGAPGSGTAGGYAG